MVKNKRYLETTQKAYMTIVLTLGQELTQSREMQPNKTKSSFYITK